MLLNGSYSMKKLLRKKFPKYMYRYHSINRCQKSYMTAEIPSDAYKFRKTKFRSPLTKYKELLGRIHPIIAREAGFLGPTCLVILENP